jgi:hypothetical protein
VEGTELAEEGLAAKTQGGMQQGHVRTSPFFTVPAIDIVAMLAPR